MVWAVVVWFGRVVKYVESVSVMNQEIRADQSMQHTPVHGGRRGGHGGYGPGHGGRGGHGGPPLYPATSQAIAYQTHSEYLPSL